MGCGEHNTKQIMFFFLFDLDCKQSSHGSSCIIVGAECPRPLFGISSFLLVAS